MADEVDYESDPEEAKLSLKMRRRVASDDEDEGDKPLSRMDSDGESMDGQGAAADYDEEEVEEEEAEEYFEGEELLEEEGDYEEEGIEREGVVGRRRDREVEDVVPAYAEAGGRLVEESMEVFDGENNDGKEWGDDNVTNQQPGEEEKKKQEPYAVPTAGAFYMHDDRFGNNSGGRNRRMFGGRKLWESKDERKWGHDKFEELTTHNWQTDEGRMSSRGRGRSRGAPRGNSLGSRPKNYDSNKYQVKDNNKYQVNDNNENTAPRSVRGRGPRRYQPSDKTKKYAPAPQNKQYRKSFDKPSQSGRTTMSASNADSNHIPAKKQVGSSLNYASPPFYPSSSSNKEVSLPQKEDAQGGPASRHVQSFPMSQSNSVVQGKNNSDYLGMDKLSIDDSTSAGKSTYLKSSSGSRSNSSSQSQHFRGHGRGSNTVSQTSYQPVATSNLVNKSSSTAHPNQRNLSQSQILAQRSSSILQSSSPPKAVVPINSSEAGELDSLSESSKSKMSFIAKGKVNMQGGGRGSYIFGGRQVMGPSGNMIAGHGDQNLPAMLPVMQFGGQHPGGMGVPAVGMAFPGYVGNPQLGNSEMTWLPVLAGAAGALGASYCPPYFAVDGAYHAHPSAQTSVPSPALSNEVSNNGSNDERKPSQRPELVNDDFGQRQKNPRRQVSCSATYDMQLTIKMMQI
ncbi:hypothetical protein LIER_16649 [Lithospermum erythrorhizon]|uniref:Btz domain-containing protein n=1 Tax=Lithospermum erythrorhizon TaxID=34254 RepID=A0AAV3QA34_LITER